MKPAIKISGFLLGVFLANYLVNASEIVTKSQELFDSGKYQESINLINSKKGQIINPEDKWQADNIMGWAYYKSVQLDCIGSPKNGLFGSMS